MNTYEFCVNTVKEAGELLLRERTSLFISQKGGDLRDMVTNVDIAVSRFITERIVATFPEDGIYSEEDIEKVSSSCVWTIDPIDGSANFARGIPHFSIVLGLLENGVPVCGAIYNPLTDELYSFERDRGAFLNGERIRVSSVNLLSDAHILFHAGRKLEVRDWGGESYRRLLGSVKKTANFSGSALDLCFLAAGRVEGVVYGTLSTKDIAPALGLLYEAGGVAGGPIGEPLPFLSTPQKVYAANNDTLLNALIALLEDNKRPDTSM
jgi:myo-inositol-1(or 4)-monophosphatase